MHNGTIPSINVNYDRYINYPFYKPNGVAASIFDTTRSPQGIVNVDLLCEIWDWN